MKLQSELQSQSPDTSALMTELQLLLNWNTQNASHAALRRAGWQAALRGRSAARPAHGAAGDGRGERPRRRRRRPPGAGLAGAPHSSQRRPRGGHLASCRSLLRAAPRERASCAHAPRAHTPRSAGPVRAPGRAGTRPARGAASRRQPMTGAAEAPQRPPAGRLPRRRRPCPNKGSPVRAPQRPPARGGAESPRLRLRSRAAAGVACGAPSRPALPGSPGWAQAVACGVRRGHRAAVHPHACQLRAHAGLHVCALSLGQGPAQRSVYTAPNGQGGFTDKTVSNTPRRSLEGAGISVNLEEATAEGLSSTSVPSWGISCEAPTHSKSSAWAWECSTHRTLPTRSHAPCLPAIGCCIQPARLRWKIRLCLHLILSQLTTYLLQAHYEGNKPAYKHQIQWGSHVSTFLKHSSQRKKDGRVTTAPQVFLHYPNASDRHLLTTDNK